MSAPIRHFVAQVNRPATLAPKDPAGIRGGQPQEPQTMLLEPMINGLGDKFSFYKQSGNGIILKNLWIENNHLVPRSGAFQAVGIQNTILNEEIIDAESTAPEIRAPGEFCSVEAISRNISLAVTCPYQKELLFDDSRLEDLTLSRWWSSGVQWLYVQEYGLNRITRIIALPLAHNPGDQWAPTAVASFGIYVGDVLVHIDDSDPANKHLTFYEWARTSPRTMPPGNGEWKYILRSEFTYTYLNSIGLSGIGLLVQDPINEIENPPPIEPYARSGEFFQDWFLIDTASGQQTKLRTEVEKEISILNFDTDSANVIILMAEGCPPIAIVDYDGDLSDLRVINYASVLSEDDSSPGNYVIYTDDVEPIDVNLLSVAFVYSRRLFFVKLDSRDIYYGHTSSFQGEFRLLPLAGTFTRSDSRIIFGTEWSYVGTSAIAKKLIIITNLGEVAIFSGDPEVDWLLESILHIPPPLTGSARSIVKVEGQILVVTASGIIELSEILKLNRNNEDTDTFRGRALTRPIESRFLELAELVDRRFFHIKYIPSLNGVFALFPNTNDGVSNILAYNIEHKAWFEWDMPILDISEIDNEIIAVGSHDYVFTEAGDPPPDEDSYSGVYRMWQNGNDLQRPIRVTGAYPFYNTEESNIHIERVVPYVFTNIKDFKLKQDLVEIPDIDVPFIDVPKTFDSKPLHWPSTPDGLRKDDSVLFNWGESWSGAIGRFDQIITREEELRPAYKPGTALSLKFEFILNLTRKPSIEIHGFLVRFRTAAPTPGADLNLFLEKTR